MKDLDIYPATKRQQSKALEKLCTLSISQNKKEKIANIIANSQFNGIYCAYLLSKNPTQYRRTRPHNKEFIAQAKDAGLDVRVLEAGIDDMGITIPLTGASHSQAKIIDYANELVEEIGTVCDAIQSASEEQLDKTHRDTPSPNTREWSSWYEENEFPTTAKEEISEALYTLNADKTYQQKLARREDINYAGDDEHHTTILTVNHERIHSTETAYESISDELRSMEIGAIATALRTAFIKTLLENSHVQSIVHLHRDKGRISIQDIPGKKRTALDRLRETLNLAATHIQETVKHYNPFLQNVEGNPFHDLDNAIDHIHRYNPEDRAASNKLRGVESAHYSLKLEALLPEDVTFGNDGGCCLAVKKDYLGNDDSIPFYQIDLGTHIFGIYQQVKNKKPQRTGMVLAFTTTDVEGRPVLAANSTELSEPTNPLDKEGLIALIRHTHDYLMRFAKAAGYTRVAMGTHNYNTSRNYVHDDSIETPDFEEQELLKLPERDEIVPFYNELFGEFNSTEPDVWAYLKS